MAGNVLEELNTYKQQLLDELSRTERIVSSMQLHAGVRGFPIVVEGQLAWSVTFLDQSS